MFSSPSDRALSEIAIASVPFNSSPKNLTQKIRTINILLLKYFVLAKQGAGCAICGDRSNGENETKMITTKKTMNKFLSLFLSMALTTLAQAQSGNAILRGSAPAWAHSKNYKGAADSNAGIGFRVYLGWNNPTAAEALARSVSNPRSSSYRQFLTAAQFRQQFAPSQA